MHHPEQFRMMAKTIEKDRLDQAMAERRAAKKIGSRTSVWMVWLVRTIQLIVNRAHLIGLWLARQGTNTAAEARALWHDIA